jgi:hypothetical protein
MERMLKNTKLNQKKSSPIFSPAATGDLIGNKCPMPLVYRCQVHRAHRVLADYPPPGSARRSLHALIGVDDDDADARDDCCGVGSIRISYLLVVDNGARRPC